MSFEGAILALDLATVTGWASGSPGDTPRCGTIELPRPVERDNGPSYASFVDWLNGMIQLQRPRLLAIEASYVAAGRNINARTVELAGGLLAIGELIAYRRAISCRVKAVASVRKHFVGKGSATKDQVYQECRRRGWAPDSLDAADALALWDCAAAIVAPERHASSLELKA